MRVSMIVKQKGLLVKISLKTFGLKFMLRTNGLRYFAGGCSHRINVQRGGRLVNDKANQPSFVSQDDSSAHCADCYRTFDAP